MREPNFTVIDHSGVAVAGDDQLDSSLKYIAAETDGYIVDRRSKEVVYDARVVVLPEDSEPDPVFKPIEPAPERLAIEA